MAYDEQLAERLRRVFAGKPQVSEKRMFGGLAFLVRGHMCVGIVESDLMLRVGAERYDYALRSPHARAMDFTGRPMKGMVYVSPAGCKRASDLKKWVGLAESFVDELPARKATAKQMKKKPKQGVSAKTAAPTKARGKGKAAAPGEVKEPRPVKPRAGKITPTRPKAAKASPKGKSQPTVASRSATTTAKKTPRPSTPASAATQRRPSTAPASRRPAKSSRLPPPGEFLGFGKGTQQFLRGLGNNNNKAWFDAHRLEYEQHYLAPALAFVNALGPKLKTLSRTVRFEPKIHGSLFRIQRDIRFSKDKTPYKNHIDLWFWHGDRKSWAPPGFFFRLEAQKLTLGAGVHRFMSEGLERYRQAVLDPRRGAALDKLLATLEREGYAIGGRTRKTVPKGYPADHARAPLLRHDGLFVVLETKPPAAVAGADFVDFCHGHFEKLAPVCSWLLKLGS